MQPQSLGSALLNEAGAGMRLVSSCLHSPAQAARGRAGACSALSPHGASMCLKVDARSSEEQ